MSSATTAAPLHFSRRDIKTTASAARSGLLVYRPAKKAKQRVAVGDRTGVVSVFSIGKRLDEVPVFSTSDADKAAAASTGAGAGGSQSKLPVSCMALFIDQVFCIRGSVLDAYSRKGKHFFSVDTNATERIHSLAVHTPFFFIAGEFMLTAFNEGRELGFFMAPDRVHQMVTFPLPAALEKAEPELRDFVSCLACNDRTLRLVQENKLVDEVACEAALTTLYFDERHRQLFYGTQMGSIGVFDIVGDQTLRRRCHFIPKQQGQAGQPQLMGQSVGGAADGGRHSAGITCMYVYDINLDDNQEVLVGYEDGTVQVFAMIGGAAYTSHNGHTPAPSSASPFTCELQSVWCGSVGEKVVSIAAGAVTQALEQPDILVHVFSGQVIAFTLDLDDAERHNMVGVEAAEAARRRQKQRETMAAKRADTEMEMAWLQETIAAKAQLLASKTGATAKKVPLVAVASTFTANVSLKPVDQSAMLSLVVDADEPLECAIIRSTSAEIAFFGTESTQVRAQHQRAGVATVTSSVIGSQADGRGGGRRRSSSSSSAPTHGGPRTKTLALATPLQQQESGSGAYGGGGGKRLEVLLWADEGHADVLTVTLYATQAPRTAQVKSVPLCALPLYRRVGTIATHFDSPLEMELSLSSVAALGDFSLRQVADWLSRLLPDMPETAAAKQLEECSQSSKSLAFFSAFLGTVLSIDFTDTTIGGGEASLIFRSDSLTALATVKRHIVRQASMSGVTFRTKDRVLYGSAARRLALLQPLMARCAEAARQAQLLEGLRELQSSDTDLSYLPDAYQKLLQSAEAVQAEAAKQRRHESYLKRSVVSLYNSLVQFQEHAPLCTPQIRANLESVCCGTRYSPEDLAKIFFPNGENEGEQREVLASAAAAAAYASSRQRQQGEQQLDHEASPDASDSNVDALSSPSINDLNEVL